MGFYSIKIIMKYLYKSLCAFILILSLVLAFFLIFMNSNSVQAAVPTITYQGVDGSGFSSADFNDIYNSFNNVKGNSQYYFCTLVLGNMAKLCVIDSIDTPKPLAKLTGNSEIISDITYTYRQYWLRGNGQTTYLGTINNATISSQPFGYNTSNHMPYIAGNIPIYNIDNFNIFWAPSEFNPIVAPSFRNYDDSNWGDTLVTGEFNYFYIEGGSYETLYLYVYDETFKVSNEPGYGWSIILDADSQYVLTNGDGSLYWAFPKSLPFGSYQNEHTYQLLFDYQDSNGDWHSSTTYRWTTNFSEAVLNGEYSDDLANINQGLDNINNFLGDDSYSQSSITNSMPSTDIQDPTSDGIGNIFTMFRNAFSTSNAQNVVIALPNTDETITIRPDLVTSHIPQPLLILIQSLYWFLICRFIIKDISKTVERAKSGEILDAQDGNIKTDLL